MFNRNELLTVRAHTQALAYLEQKELINQLFLDMEDVWLHLHTKEKNSPIIEQVGTNIKRQLVKMYAIRLINKIRSVTGLDLLTRLMDPIDSYWNADDVITRLADTKTESHRALFNALLVGIFGLSTSLIDFMEKESVTKGDLYDLIKLTYYIDIRDYHLDDNVTTEDIVRSLDNYLKNTDDTLFEITYL